MDEEEGQEENEKEKRMRGWNDFGDGRDDPEYQKGKEDDQREKRG